MRVRPLAIRLRACALVVLLCLGLGRVGPVAAQDGTRPQPVPPPADRAAADLTLLLAVDASASVTPGGWVFQLLGHAAAFRDPRVQAAIGSGPAGRIAVMLARFDGPGSLTPLVPWRLVGTPEEADAFAAEIEAAPVDDRDGATAIGSAIELAIPLLATAPGGAPRRTLDISSNGFSNAGIEPAEARLLADAFGITINGLVIHDEFDWLDEYFVENVITGVGAFVRTASGPQSFFEALVGKLIVEIVSIQPAGSTRLARR